jgi:hypothetical protein
MLNIRILVVLLFASFGFAEHGVVHAQETHPAESANAEPSASLPEAPTLAWLSNSAADAADNAGPGKDAEARAALGVTRPQPIPRRITPEREVAIEGFVSYGNWQIFAAGESEALYTAGLEYDRNSWGRFAGADGLCQRSSAVCPAPSTACH